MMVIYYIPPTYSFFIYLSVIFGICLLVTTDRHYFDYVSLLIMMVT